MSEFVTSASSTLLNADGSRKKPTLEEVQNIANGWLDILKSAQMRAYLKAISRFKPEILKDFRELIKFIDDEHQAEMKELSEKKDDAAAQALLDARIAAFITQCTVISSMLRNVNTSPLEKLLDLLLKLIIYIFFSFITVSISNVYREFLWRLMVQKPGVKTKPSLSVAENLYAYCKKHIIWPNINEKEIQTFAESVDWGKIFLYDYQKDPSVTFGGLISLIKST